jgi:cytochrome c-type biogenesis protein CcmH
MKRSAVALALMLAAAPAHAVAPGEAMADPALEARARAISQDLRCMVCQSQSIDESDAPLAHDLRLLVRARLAAGDTDEAVEAYIAARYGDKVRMTPPLDTETLLLWFGPLLFLIGAGGATAAFFRKGGGPSP